MLSTEDGFNTLGMILGTVSLFGVIFTLSAIGFRVLSTARKTDTSSKEQPTVNEQQLQPSSNQQLQLMPSNGDVQFVANGDALGNWVNMLLLVGDPFTSDIAKVSIPNFHCCECPKYVYPCKFTRCYRSQKASNEGGEMF